MITLPTRITTDTATSIDVCLTNMESNHITAGAILYDISDHLPIFCFGSFLTSKDKRCTERVLHRKINEETLGTFSDLIGQENWDDVYTENDPVLAYRKFLVKFKHSYDAAFPLCQSRLRPKKIRKPWVTGDLYKQIKQKDRKYHAFIKHRDPRLLDEFKKCRNKLNSDLKQAKSVYYQNKFTHLQNDYRKLWETVNNLTSRKQPRCNVKELIINNDSVTGKDLSDEMNRYFIDVGTFTGNNAHANDRLLIRNQPGSIMLMPTSPLEIDKIITSLKTDVAAGDDGIKALPIKRTVCIIIQFYPT